MAWELRKRDPCVRTYAIATETRVNIDESGDDCLRDPQTLRESAREVVLGDLAFRRSSPATAVHRKKRLLLHDRGILMVKHRISATPVAPGDAKRQGLAQAEAHHAETNKLMPVKMDSSVQQRKGTLT